MQKRREKQPGKRKQIATILNHGLAIDETLYKFLIDQALPRTGVDADHFFSEFSRIVGDLAPVNRALLARLKDLQAKLDAWYRKNGAPTDLFGCLTLSTKSI
jgi:malate synthase